MADLSFVRTTFFMFVLKHWPEAVAKQAICPAMSSKPPAFLLPLLDNHVFTENGDCFGQPFLLKHLQVLLGFFQGLLRVSRCRRAASMTRTRPRPRRCTTNS